MAKKAAKKVTKKSAPRKKKKKMDMDKIMKGVTIGLSIYKAYKRAK